MTDTQRSILPDDEIQLWMSSPARVDDPATLARYQALLSPGEQAQQARLHFAHDRHRYLVTRALVRTVLSRYAATTPGDWRFAPTAHGRPTLVEPGEDARDLVFNLSHSKELVVCAVRRHGALGVDTENLCRKVSLSTAEHCFSAPELGELQALPAAAQPARFLALWTLKESYVKARGLGLAIPLDDFGFRLADSGRIDAYFKRGDDPARWRFWQLDCGRGNLVALCAQNDRPLRLRWYEGAPLQAWQPVEPGLLRCSA